MRLGAIGKTDTVSEAGANRNLPGSVDKDQIKVLTMRCLPIVDSSF